MPNSPAASYAMSVAAATRITGATVLNMPTERPWMILVAAPVSLDLAMPFTGPLSDVKYSVDMPIRKPLARPAMTA